MLMSTSLLNDIERSRQESLIGTLPGPILVLGAGGFIGSAAFSTLCEFRSDVVGVGRDNQTWRTEALGTRTLHRADLRNMEHVQRLLNDSRPALVINLSAVGAYPSQQHTPSMIDINVTLVEVVARWCAANSAILVHAGSSSEYGTNCAGPAEDDICRPNSSYSVTKLAGTHLLQQVSRETGLAAAILRFYSIYGPLEEPTRLVPTLIREGLHARLPQLSSRNVSRDFTYVVDALEAIWMAASYLSSKTNNNAEIFNIGTGKAVSMADVAEIATESFGVRAQPSYKENLRSWDLEHWFANPNRSYELLGWTARTQFREGLLRTADWYKDSERMELLEARESTDISLQAESIKLSAVIACYRDVRAIPIMHSRLVSVFNTIGCDYEIIFVNDASPDDTADVLDEICRRDDRVVAVTHTRNFGSQAAFMSGLEISTGSACVLLDGDLQDPPELIEQFFHKWREGYDVVYGVRTSRETSLPMRVAYKIFYKMFSALSAFPVPRDAGDFSLMSRRVVDELLKFPERDLFLRTNRAYIGGKQVGISYHRPERAFGQSTNSPIKNIQWALKGVLSSSRKPLSMLSAAGVSLAGLSTLGLVLQIAVRLVAPSAAPPGVVTLILLIGVFGSVNLLAISIVGEYVGRILDEVRDRPRYIRQSVYGGRAHNDRFATNSTGGQTP